MSRQTLTTAVESACKAAGFDFETGFEYRLASQIDRLPVAWLETPRLQKTVGRSEGTKYYDVKINLLDRCAGQTPDAREALWDLLESKASQIVDTLRTHEAVIAMQDVALQPGECPLTAAGELSLGVECVALISF